jgi:hypothetical protein
MREIRTYGSVGAPGADPRGDLESPSDAEIGPKTKRGRINPTEHRCKLPRRCRSLSL